MSERIKPKNNSEGSRMIVMRSDYRPCQTFSLSSAIKKHIQATDSCFSYSCHQTQL